ncbi:MAG: ABC transporter ATP-binding protein [Bacillota bacterium]|nr:ABC transporter ATP-binding protein [Bacillota bacterium]
MLRRKKQKGQGEEALPAAAAAAKEEEAVIQVRGLRKVYQNGEIEVEALTDVDLTVRRGEFLAIMGASGSGKSTFMNILGCLDRPTEGSYRLEGVDTREQDDNQLSFVRNQKIGFVFQSFNLIPRTSALKNVELPMVYGRTPGAKRRERALELMESVGLGDRGEHQPNELSGGQRQRVAIARALANDPPIILADEPTGNLDSQSSMEIMEIFEKLNRERGCTVIVVTHEPDIAGYAGRVVTFRDGRIVSDRSTGREKKEAAPCSS